MLRVTRGVPFGMNCSPAAAREDWNRFFNHLIREPLNSLGNAAKPGEWQPALDVEALENEIVVRLEVPGIDPTEIEINVEENRLTISGEKKTQVQAESNGLRHRESHCGKFARIIGLPDGVDTEKTSADSALGVLTIKLPKIPVVAPKKIHVNVSHPQIGEHVAKC